MKHGDFFFFASVHTSDKNIQQAPITNQGCTSLAGTSQYLHSPAALSAVADIDKVCTFVFCVKWYQSLDVISMSEAHIEVHNALFTQI